MFYMLVTSNTISHFVPDNCFQSNWCCSAAVNHLKLNNAVRVDIQYSCLSAVSDGEMHENEAQWCVRADDSNAIWSLKTCYSYQWDYNITKVWFTGNTAVKWRACWKCETLILWASSQVTPSSTVDCGPADIWSVKYSLRIYTYQSTPFTQQTNLTKARLDNNSYY